jgi:2-polyprenyl-6-methoxyphenol hydroxylase-like FAD-dependent oxidoreductase
MTSSVVVQAFRKCAIERPSIIVCGGGIGGLAFAAAARARGAKVAVLERDTGFTRQNNPGSGIGLWPPALHALAGLSTDLLVKLEKNGRYMSQPAYADGRGRVLAAPSPRFSSQFPVLCLRREVLLNALMRHCADAGVLTHYGVSITGVRILGEGSNRALVECASGQSLGADFVVGADGLHSRVRAALSAADSTAVVPSPIHCGYVYFRANVAVVDPAWHARAFEAWHGGLRFGVVPLRHPEIFWFASVPLKLTREWDLSAAEGELRGARVIDAASHAHLEQAFSGWRAPNGLTISAVLSATPPAAILHTDIWKLPAVTRRPWATADGRVVLLGDACHATAPNIAQGAGLAIEDALDLAATMLLPAQPISTDPGSPPPPVEPRGTSAAGQLTQAAVAYQAMRKPRAATVQWLADSVAAVGHLDGAAATVRDAVLRAVGSISPGAVAWMFERIVSFALGGRVFPGGRLHWLPPPPPPRSSDQERIPFPNLSCPIALAAGWPLFRSLPPHVQRFRSESAVSFCSGFGTVTVDPPGALLRRALGLPESMEQAPFEASVVPEGSQASACGQPVRQRWTRAFGSGPGRAVYSTTHTVARCLNAPSGWLLLESVGGPLDSTLSFGYTVTAASPGASDCGSQADASGVQYTSVGVWLFGRYQLPLPTALLPQSSWVEKLSPSGWNFDGSIRLPAAIGGGTIMRYSGEFCCNNDCRNS